MTSVVKKNELSRDRQWLLEEMTRLNHGRIMGLRIQGGQPVRESATILHTVKFCSNNGPHARCGLKNYQLRQEVTELVDILDKKGDFVIVELIVVSGLPTRMTIKETTGM